MSHLYTLLSLKMNTALRCLLLLCFVLPAVQPALSQPRSTKQKLAQTQADSALMLLAVYGNKQHSLAKSLHYISQAIANDARSEYYDHKLAILCQLGNHRKQAIALLDTMKATGAKTRIYTVMQGNLLEKEGLPAKAQALYKAVIAQCDSLIAANPNNTPALTDRILAIQFAHDKATLLAEYAKLKAAYPNTPEVQDLEEPVTNFDKKRFLERFCR